MLKNFALVGAILFRTSSRIDTNLIVNPRNRAGLAFASPYLGAKILHFIEMAKNNPNFFFVIPKKMSSFADEI